MKKLLSPLLRGTFLVAICSASTYAQPLTPLSLASNDWSAYPPTSAPPGRIEETPEGLRAYTYDRSGTYLLSNLRFDFANSTTKVKWSAWGGGVFEQTLIGLNYTYGSGLFHDNFSTGNSFAGSVVITENTWYFTTLTVDGDGNWRFDTATGNYVDAGGALFVTEQGQVDEASRDQLHTAGIQLYVGDSHYGMTYPGQTWMMFGEVATDATPIPEPTVGLLMTTMLAAFGLFRLKRRQ